MKRIIEKESWVFDRGEIERAIYQLQWCLRAMDTLGHDVYKDSPMGRDIKTALESVLKENE